MKITRCGARYGAKLAGLLFLTLLIQAPTWVGAETSDSDSVSVTERSEVSGTGHANGYCGGPQGNYCHDQVKRQAQDDAVRDAERVCSFKSGKAYPYQAWCNEYCSPYSLPYDAPMQVVSCSSTCRMPCET